MNRVMITVADDALGVSLGKALFRLLVRQGHQAQFLRDTELAALSPAALAARLAGITHVVHLSEAVPPLTDEDQYAAYRRNVEATRRLVAASLAQPHAPRFFLRSTWGDAAPGRALDSYHRQKAECEALLRETELDHTLVRIGTQSTPPAATPTVLAQAIVDVLDATGSPRHSLQLMAAPARGCVGDQSAMRNRWRHRLGLTCRALRAARAFIFYRPARKTT